jgi:hypothetical protein
MGWRLLFLGLERMVAAVGVPTHHSKDDDANDGSSQHMNTPKCLASDKACMADLWPFWIFLGVLVSSNNSGAQRCSQECLGDTTSNSR